MRHTRTVLFVCTGNYYRSRFAEEIFNHNAPKRGLDWRADSSGLKVAELGHVNPGTFSPHADAALETRQIRPLARAREPRQFEEPELATADLCIALSESEHRPMVLSAYPHLVEKIQFWTVEDIGFEDPVRATDRIEVQVLELIALLDNG